MIGNVSGISGVNNAPVLVPIDSGELSPEGLAMEFPSLANLGQSLDSSFSKRSQQMLRPPTFQRLSPELEEQRNAKVAELMAFIAKIQSARKVTAEMYAERHRLYAELEDIYRQQQEEDADAVRLGERRDKAERKGDRRDAIQDRLEEAQLRREEAQARQSRIEQQRDKKSLLERNREKYTERELELDYTRQLIADRNKQAQFVRDGQLKFKKDASMRLRALMEKQNFEESRAIALEKAKSENSKAARERKIIDNIYKGPSLPVQRTIEELKLKKQAEERKRSEEDQIHLFRQREWIERMNLDEDIREKRKFDSKMISPINELPVWAQNTKEVVV